MNEAALLAASRDHEAVGRADFEDALERLILGTGRRKAYEAAGLAAFRELYGYEGAISPDAQRAARP